QPAPCVQTRAAATRTARTYRLRGKLMSSGSWGGTAGKVTPPARVVNSTAWRAALCRLTRRAPEFYYDVGQPRDGLDPFAGTAGRGSDNCDEPGPFTAPRGASGS